MSLFETIALLLSVTALLSYFNHRRLGLPPTIGLMLTALSLSLLLLGLDRLGLGLESWAQRLLQSVQFDQALLHGMLAYLLFAGALHVNVNDLIERRWVVAALATFGVSLSTLLVGSLVWWISHWIHVPLRFQDCLLFGALISPTDPIAVLGILRKVGAPRSLQASITGESLFNDGIGVVLFLILLRLLEGEEEVGVAQISGLFFQEVAGGALLGLLLGYLTYRLLKKIDNYQLEILLTLALVSFSYAAAGRLHVSGPIAVVVAGLLIGNQGRVLAMSERTRERLDTFWELVDEILNAVLFVLLGLEFLLISFTSRVVWLATLSVPSVLLARWLSVTLLVQLLRPVQRFIPHAALLLTWGGLRGGISVALALSLPPIPARETLISMTYLVVVFSILVQGLTVGSLIGWSQRGANELQSS